MRTHTYIHTYLYTRAHTHTQVRAVTEHKYTADRLMYKEGMKLAARLEEEEAALKKELQVSGGRWFADAEFLVGLLFSEFFSVGRCSARMLLIEPFKTRSSGRADKKDKLQSRYPVFFSCHVALDLQNNIPIFSSYIKNAVPLRQKPKLFNTRDLLLFHLSQARFKHKPSYVKVLVSTPDLQ